MLATHCAKRLPLTALVIVALLLSACGDGGSSTPVSAPAAAPPAQSTPAALAVVLAGTPPGSVIVGSHYLFQPTVAQGGGLVSFSIQGQPAWMTFDPDTGALTGSPSAGNVGRTGSITISASNGDSTSSIGPFTVVVNAAAVVSGSATLSWIAPAENTDGTPITNLAGYHIYYGTTAGNLAQSVTVDGAAATSYTFTGLSAGTYYFSVVAYNSAGLDSTDSNQATKTI